MNLSEHFTLEEFTRSATALKYGINNTPNQEQIANLKALCENVLEPLRQHFNVPIIINSGFRCGALNSHPEVNGASNSNHLYGYAADIRIPDIATGNRWFAWMMDNLEFDELIKERNTKTSPTFWIHVAFKRNGQNRQIVKFNLIKNL